MRDLINSFFQKVRLLTILILVATLAFLVRLGDAATDLRSLTGAAQAQEKQAQEKSEDKAPETKDEKSEKSPETEKEPEKEKSEAPKVDLPKTASADEKSSDEKSAPAPKSDSKWQDAADSDIEYSDTRASVLGEIRERRQLLDQKEKDLAQREALLKAAENEIDQKVTELTKLREEIKGLLSKQSAEEQQNVGRLVKIYEGMKPKDAARIFNTLDMDVLLAVVSNMSERKSAPIIAAMDAERAKTLTLFLAEQQKLPSLNEATARAGNAPPVTPNTAATPTVPPVAPEAVPDLLQEP
jgi:flagellar motility protein MotE (MotC chaperone)